MAKGNKSVLAFLQVIQKQDVHLDHDVFYDIMPLTFRVKLLHNTFISPILCDFILQDTCHSHVAKFLQ